MTVFIVETYVVKPEKQAEFKSMLRKIAKYKKRKPTNLQRDEIKENLLPKVRRHLRRLHRNDRV